MTNLTRGKRTKKVSTDESTHGGELPPIQFSTKENPLSDDDNLYPFAEACRQLGQHNADWEVAVAIEQIEGHRDFCQVAGRSRRCCVVEVRDPKRQPILLFELERKEGKGCSILEIRRGKPIDTLSIVRALLAAVPESPHGWKVPQDFFEGESLDLRRHNHPMNLDESKGEAKVSRLKAMLVERLGHL